MNKQKISIREFVSEEEVKYQLYLMKYSNQIRDLERFSKEEVIDKWETANSRKIAKFIKDLDKPKYSDDLSQYAIKKNIEYLKKLKPPTNKEIIKEKFIFRRDEYVMYLESRIKENNKGSLREDEELLKVNKELKLTSDISKERFGIIMLLIIDNISTMPSFSGYSENWKTDFYSNSIEKILLYHNFDENLLSKRTGKKSKAFAYITQICFNAFINIINIRKSEQNFLKDVISYETHNFDGVKDLLFKQKDNQYLLDEEIKKEDLSKYSIIIKNKDKIKERFINGLDFIKLTNSLIEERENLEFELIELEQEIEKIKLSKQEVSEEILRYKQELLIKKPSLKHQKKIETFEVILPKGYKLEGDFLKILDSRDTKSLELNINIIREDSNRPKEIERKYINDYDSKNGLTKIQKEKIDKKKNEVKEEMEFYEEW